ncbi:MAG: hypothetical protein ACPHXR_01215 [Flavicella sp.]
MEKELQLNDQVKAYFQEIGKWARFLGIVGYIGIGLLLVVSFAVPYFISFLGASELSQIPPSTLATVYFILAGVYFFPVNYLYKFGVKIKSSMAHADEISFEEAVKNLKSHYKFIGVFTLILISMYGFIFVMSLIAFLF